MRRGKIWTVSDSGYAGKPRPALVVQGDDFPMIDFAVICALTTEEVSAPLVRILIEPSPQNGLRERSWVMVDKISAVRSPKFGRRIGRLENATMTSVEQALRLFLQLG